MDSWKVEFGLLKINFHKEFRDMSLHASPSFVGLLQQFFFLQNKIQISRALFLMLKDLGSIENLRSCLIIYPDVGM